MTRLDPRFLERPIAHRALHGMGRPENSVEAIEAACDAGYGIEIDLQLSADGQAMVFHDYDLRRLTKATGAIRHHTADELRNIHLVGARSGIPTLPEVLDRIDGRVPLLIEIKDQDGGLGPKVGELEEATAEALKSYSGAVSVMSFNPHSIARMASLCPDIARGLTTCDYAKDDWPSATKDRLQELQKMEDVTRLGCSFISHDRRDLKNPRVADLKSQGIHVLCWTIRSAQQEAEARTVAENVTFENYAPA
ncbi:glycerophosphodiester phosphodiesterase family protein [Donghicola sp. XS_ASV15]|uniref:glycerophosphodiester phosphodiesterase family protein n=1 Tax=Donghicola sp. XS_ASV15 TaxID=3241295 RepID=UPI0035190C13